MPGRRLLIAVVLVAAAAGVAAPAAAHCPDGSEATVVAGVSTCTTNEHLETALDRLNAASDEDKVYVLVKDLSFHPPTVDLADEGTVVFVWGDVDHQKNHDPQSSGATGDDCGTAGADPVDCEPEAPGACFSFEGVMNEPGDTYEVTLASEPDGTVLVSEGAAGGDPVVGEPPFSPAFLPCPDGTATAHPTEDRLVVPYHCGLHGKTNTPTTQMRGAILLET